MKTITMSKQFGVVQFDKAQLENYNHKLVAESDSETEVQAEYDRLSESDNAVMGYAMVVRDDAGNAVAYA